MSKRAQPRILVPLTLGALLVLLVWVSVSLSRKPPLRFQRLPDGTEVAPAGVTYGMNHQFTWGSGWQRLLLALPDPWQEPFGRARFDWTANGNLGNVPHRNDPTLALWVMHRGPAGRIPDLRAVPVDRAGIESAPWPYGEMRWRTPIQGSRDQLGLYEFAQFPRRERELTVRLYPEMSGGTPGAKPRPLADLTVPNPEQGPFPVWKAEPLPATRQDGDLQITVDGLATGPPAPTSGRSPGSGEESVTVLSLRLQPRNQGEIWNSRSVEFSDATGNHWSNLGHGIDFTPSGGERWTFGGGLWASEPAYRVHLEMAHTDVFSPAITWKTPRLALPARGKSASYHLRKSLPDAEVELLELWAAGSPAPEKPDASRSVTARFRVTGPAKGKQLNYVEGRDDRGRVIHTAGVTRKGTDAPGGDEYRFELRVQPDARWMELSVSADRTRSFEFLVGASPTRR